MLNKENLYFIALIPQKEVYDEITAIKSDFANRFASNKALKVMPHLTLKSPFRFPIHDHDKLVSWFINLSTSEKPFQVELKNFGVFNRSKHPVVFVDPVTSAPLSILQNEIIRSFKDSFPACIHRSDETFKPHITVAYRDLTPGKFREAWNEYKSKEYHAIFRVNSFHLLQHDTRQWKVIESNTLK